MNREIENNFGAKIAPYKLLEDTYKDMKIITKEKSEYLRREIGTIKTRQDKLLDMYMDGEIKKEVYEKKNANFESQLENLERELRVNKMSDEKFINECKITCSLSILNSRFDNYFGTKICILQVSNCLNTCKHLPINSQF